MYELGLYRIGWSLIAWRLAFEELNWKGWKPYTRCASALDLLPRIDR
jgi:hypothetical protein